MINLYEYYNKAGLDNEHYGKLIETLMYNLNSVELKEIEHFMKRDPYWAYTYARDVIMERWPDAEPYIMKDPWVACLYAKSVIGGVWSEAEPHIKTDDYWWKRYNEVVLNQ